MDCDRRRGRTERAGHLGDRGARLLRAARLHRSRALVAVSGGRRHLRLEQARVRPVRGVHHRWTYWGSNLPYLPGLLYFAAANVLFIGGPAWQAWSSNSVYFVAVATVGLAIAVTMNVVGLNVGKWLNNAGAVAELGRRGAVDRARRACRGAASARRRRSAPRAGSEHEPEGRDLLVDDRLCLRRRRKRIDDGGRDSGRAPHRAARDPDRRRADHASLYRRDDQRAARDAERSGVGAAGHHAGDPGADRKVGAPWLAPLRPRW